MLHSLFKRLSSFISNNGERRRTPGRLNQRRFRPSLESLEDRTVPSLVFNVNTANDTQDALVGDGFAQDQAGNTSLRAAIEEGNAAAAGTTVIITINQGVGTISLGIALPNLNREFSIDGVNAGTVIERNPAVGEFRIFTINAGATANLIGLEIANGRARAGGGEWSSFGGGILNFGTLSLYSVVIHDNVADNSGGGIMNAAGASLTVRDSDLYYNRAMTGGGGAILNAGQAVIEDGSDIYVNEAVLGGGLYNFTGAQLTITSGSQLNSNTASSNGGGIYNLGTLTMSNAILANNETTSGNGAGLYSMGTANLTSVSITSNHATGANSKGGGVYVRSGTTTLTTCTISGNTCGLAGGGNGGCWFPGATLTTINCIIFDAIVQDPNP
ncbi:MAG: hypothetical protein L0215_05280 [Gemmataceae bacterium]|nr:hypothetical protein [Gemmataceae bacterium]